jgi:geranylgeranyl diphosphate synthase type I
VKIHPLDANGLRERIQLSLDNFVSDHKAMMLAVSLDTLPLVESLEGLLAGGKRLRPAFAYWGFHAAGGKDSEDGGVESFGDTRRNLCWIRIFGTDGGKDGD